MSVEARFRLTRTSFALDVDLTFEARGFSVLIGRSGSGKTSLLRCIAGLERAEAARLVVSGSVWEDARRFLPVHKRPIGYVFQEPSLFPHLSVRNNLTYGLRRVPVTARRVALDQAVALLGIEELLDRRPATLSGGQRQRVAIARALLTSPELLLMDEPLASLDEESKAQVLPYFESLQSALGIPVLYVTHSLQEAARLADALYLLEQGRLRAHGPPGDLLTRPELWPSQLEDAFAVLDTVVLDHAPEYHLMHVRVGDQALSMSSRPLPPGHTMRIQVRARDVSLSLGRQGQSSISNALEAKVIDITEDRDPAHRLVRLQVDGATLLSRVTHQSVVQLALSPGSPVMAQVKSVAIV